MKKYFISSWIIFDNEEEFIIVHYDETDYIDVFRLLPDGRYEWLKDNSNGV